MRKLRIVALRTFLNVLCLNLMTGSASVSNNPTHFSLWNCHIKYLSCLQFHAVEYCTTKFRVWFSIHTKRFLRSTRFLRGFMLPLEPVVYLGATLIIDYGCGIKVTGVTLRTVAQSISIDEGTLLDA